MDWRDVEVVSWDLDGTLYDSDAFWRAFKAKAWAGLRPGCFFRTLSELWVLRRYRHWIKISRARGGEIRSRPLDGARSDRIIDRWLSETLREIGPGEGVQSLMEALAQRGIRQVVVTDLRCGGKLQALRLPQCIERVFEGERLGWIKPHPQLFSVVLEELSVTPDSVLHIGDRRDTDLIAAQQHGVRCLILGDDFDDFPSLIATLT
jgi:FMN phosphatase YigB (HAD superfamily)